MKVVVLGAAGQLGRVTAARWAATADVRPLTRADVDLTDARALEACLDGLRPDVIINCAAYNDVDGAEDDPPAALAVNALAVRSLAAAARRCGAALVHYSTDFVFDGRGRDQPYTEDDLPAPQSVYATSKLLGEWFAAEVPRHYVLRVESLFGGVYVRSSIDRLADAIRRGAEARVFVDRTVTPSYVADVAAATEALLRGGAEPGLYHCVNSGTTHWGELGEELARLLGREGTARLVPVEFASVPLKAKRPQYCALSNAKLRAAGVEMPEWRDALRRYFADADA